MGGAFIYYIITFYLFTYLLTFFPSREILQKSMTAVRKLKKANRLQVNYGKGWGWVGVKVITAGIRVLPIEL